MGDSKQVRVDNWGTYFLQRLQQFFNKTDYCDLTLQFEGNVQLKVHRLVMSACTEYFQLLEQTCETVDDILIMPPDLQADVILPIVNFMYTGILEFQMITFDKLYRTAELMNIPVLMKLLDAQKKPAVPLVKTKKSTPVPHTWNLQGKKIVAKTADPDLPAPLPGRKIPVWKRKTAPSPNTQQLTENKIKQETFSSFDNAPKPTRFEWPEEDSLLFNLMDSSFDDISYTSKPLLTQDDEQRASASSAFDDIKHLPNFNKKTRTLESNSSLDMEDMKDYIKEQKIRSDLVEYDDDDVDNDLGVFEASTPKPESLKRKAETPASANPIKRVRFSVIEKENKETTINIAAPQTSISEVNHSKIISEVLKKYPHLVKKNKNIRLKILAKNPNKSSDSPSRVQTFKTTTSKVKLPLPSSKVVKAVPQKADLKKDDEGPWTCAQCSANGEQGVEFVLYYLYLKHMSEVHNEKIDPRICKFCGHKSTKHNMLMYHQYTKHGIQPPPAYKFPKCTQCPYIAVSESLLVKHKLNHLKFDFECQECKVAFNNVASLQSHMQITAHSGKSGKMNFDCQYCTKKYQHGAGLFSHIKLQHREEAKRDGVISIDEIENFEENTEDAEEEPEPFNQQQNQEQKTTSHAKEIKILSNLKVDPTATTQAQEIQTAVNLEPSSEAEALSNVASGIATSLGLVDIVVLDDNQQYILHSNDQQLVSQQSLGNSSSEFILPELTETHTFTTNQTISDHNVITQTMLNNSDITSTDELVMVLTDHDYNDGNSEILNNENSNIVVLYSHPVEGQENQYITSQGNLMLNSQTGMIEIRNTMPATTTADQIVISPEETHIESIEMIQREINSHREPKSDDNCQIEKTTIITSSITTLPTTVEPLTQNTEILENESVITVPSGVSVPTILETPGPSLDTLALEKDSNIIFNAADDILVETTEKIEDTREKTPEVEAPLAPVQEEVKETEEETAPVAEEDVCAAAEPMEIDEECPNNQSEMVAQPEETEQEKMEEESQAETIMETEATVPEETQTNKDRLSEVQDSICNIKSMSNLDLPPPDSYMEFTNEEQLEFEPEKQEEVHENEAAAVEEVEEQPPSQEEEKGEENTELENTELENTELENTELEKKSAEEEEQQEVQEEIREEENISSEKVEESFEPPLEILEPQVEEEAKETATNNAEVGEENQVNEEESVEKENIVEEAEKQQEIVEIDEVAEEGNKVLEEVIEESIAKDEEVDNLTTDEALKEVGTENEKLVESQNEESAAVVEEGGCVETVETETVSMESQDDENSQSKEDPAVDNKPSVIVAPRRESTSETTKIAILDDWDDTDSQPSDQGEINKPLSVNKLIDEWGDDEDEDSRK